jgi:exodeoxyribonuclease V alpha subunit
MRIQIAKERNCGLLTAYQINDDGSILSRPHGLAILMPKRTNGVATVGSVWEVQGELSHESYKKDNFQVIEDRIKVKKAKFIRPVDLHLKLTQDLHLKLTHPLMPIMA